ncbi:MAG TPA: cob(I)yrinic acid a,c-diamide adenosyltransferase [Erysipelothrix sp.]|nr:cob(I)yrinic acid a,c-diamide adenosyltransferase [Erysipelothrix sp.]
MKIYTKKGDKGQTSLFDSKKVYKDDIRVESYGLVDELGSYIGLTKHYVGNQDIFNTLEHIQNKLFVVTTNLATEHKENVLHKITEADIKDLEDIIDNYLAKVPAMEKFILPGSSIGSAHLHVCRTLARNAERRIVSLMHIEEVDPLVIKYINRLSDTLFALARYLETDEKEVQY